MDEHADAYLSNEELEVIFSAIMEEKLRILRVENDHIRTLLEHSRECIRRSLKS